MDELRRRCTTDGTVRPLATDQERFARLYEERLAAYQMATHKVNTMGKTVQDVTAEIARLLASVMPEWRSRQGSSNLLNRSGHGASSLLRVRETEGTKGRRRQGLGFGSFGIFVNGKRVGTEKFKIQQRGDPSVTTSELKMQQGAYKASQKSEMASGTQWGPPVVHVGIKPAEERTVKGGYEKPAAE